VKATTAHPAPPSPQFNLLSRRNKSKSLIKIQSIWEVSKQRLSNYSNIKFVGKIARNLSNGKLRKILQLTVKIVIEKENV
jgi:hypothetical protein